MRATCIDWDTDGNMDLLKNLPTEMEIPEGMTDREEISDYISDEVGYCHYGFVLEENMIKIISENEDRNKITNEATLEEWEKDFWNDCNFVPSNDDRVIFVSVDGKEIPLEEIAEKAGDDQLPVDFEQVADYLGFKK